jgi:hypothetical protein
MDDVIYCPGIGERRRSSGVSIRFFSDTIELKLDAPAKATARPPNSLAARISVVDLAIEPGVCGRMPRPKR